MSVLSMEKHNFEASTSYLRAKDEVKLEDGGKKLSPQKWGNEKLFSPARELQNPSTPNNQYKEPLASSHVNFLKFHPYLREHCSAQTSFPHFIPYIPPKSIASSDTLPELSQSKKLPSINFNPFLKKRNILSDEGEHKEKEIVVESAKTPSNAFISAEKNPEKSNQESDKMASASTKQIKGTLCEFFNKGKIKDS